ncbi:hypothetical protein DFH09DRAFT_1308432 [Mycena vulgaris]|nr:hypothetical protein DFH09DRAFT_1308432 [Mycena vulgaris]
MALPFLGNAYRLVSVLCVLQIASALTTIYLYGLDMRLTYLQSLPAVQGTLTLQTIYCDISPFTHSFVDAR